MDSDQYKFYGQFDPPLDKYLFERYYADRKEPATFIECGAFDGELESSCKFFEESLGWRAINIEASPSIYQKLVINRPNSLNINAALSSQSGNVKFTDVHHPAHPHCTNGSVSHLEAHRQMLDEANCTYSTLTVPAITFKDLISQLSLESIELMVLDVEGHELDAIAGFHGARTLPDVVCVEHGHLGVSKIEEAMRPLGYELDDVIFVNSIYVRSRVDR